MRTVNMHEAKTHLSQLVKDVQTGETIVIAKAGKPVAQVIAFRAVPKKALEPIGFLKDEMTVSDDIKTSFVQEMEEMFYGSNDRE